MSNKGSSFLSRGLTEHHILPRSRGGSDEASNLVALPKKIHEAWHICFGNDTPEEVVAKMLLVWEVTCPFEGGAGPIDEDRLKKRRKAWKVLFGKAGQEEAIQITVQKFGTGREKYIQRVNDAFWKNHKKNP